MTRNREPPQISPHGRRRTRRAKPREGRGGLREPKRPRELSLPRSGTTHSKVFISILIFVIATIMIMLVSRLWGCGLRRLLKLGTPGSKLMKPPKHRRQDLRTHLYGNGVVCAFGAGSSRSTWFFDLDSYSLRFRQVFVLRGLF